jgi:serine/threonine-protein kinase
MRASFSTLSVRLFIMRGRARSAQWADRSLFLVGQVGSVVPVEDNGSAPTAADTGGPIRSGASNGTPLVRGDLVGEYVIESQLGAGGMGQVYAVVHPVIGKRAAIKVLSPELSHDADAVTRFVQEARAVNQIGHPNIIDIFGFGALPDGRSYYVMERLSGESLGTRLRRGRIGSAFASLVLGTLASALEAVHGQQIAHRDLKPDNVFLSKPPGGPMQIKLLDFGIAKLLALDTSSSQLTKAGSMLGTPAYISPEQARAHGVDVRTDIYSLGVMAFEMYTGRLPFTGNTALELIWQNLSESPPAVRSLAPDVPEAIDALIAAMLAKSPSDRPTLAEVRAVLEPYGDAALDPSDRRSTPRIDPCDVATISGPAVTQPSQPARRRHGVLAIAAVVCVVIGVGAAILISVALSGPHIVVPPRVAAPQPIAIPPQPIAVPPQPIATPPQPIAVPPQPQPDAAPPPQQPPPISHHPHGKHPTTPAPAPPPVDLDSPR